MIMCKIKNKKNLNSDILKQEMNYVYIVSDNVGGPGCYECGYESKESDNIICKSCYPYYHQVFPDRNYNPDIYEYRYPDSIKTILSSKNK